MLLFVDCKFQTWMFIIYTFAGAGQSGEYGEGSAFYEHYQLNSGRVFFCFQRGELVFVLVVEERAAVPGALAKQTILGSDKCR